MKAWKALVPVLVAALLLILPPPAGLPLHAWRYFALFAGVVIALVLEPLPGGALGLIGLTAVTITAKWTFFSPETSISPALVRIARYSASGSPEV